MHALNSLASPLPARGDPEEEPIIRRALALRQSATGPDHPVVGDQLQWLAQELARQRRLRAAETLMRQALAQAQRKLGPQHQRVITARMRQLAEILELQGRHREADQLYRTALEQNRYDNVSIAQMRHAYGRLLLRQGDYARAEEQLLQSLRLLEQSYPARADHPNVQETKRALMELYARVGQTGAGGALPGAAGPLGQLLIQLRTRYEGAAQGPDHKL